MAPACVSWGCLSSCWARWGQSEPALHGQDRQPPSVPPPEAAVTAAALSQPGVVSSRPPDWIYYCSFLLTQPLNQASTSQETPQQHLKASAEADLPLPGYGSREVSDSLHFVLILFLKPQNVLSWKGPTRFTDIQLLAVPRTPQESHCVPKSIVQTLWQAPHFPGEPDHMPNHPAELA